MPIGLGGVPGLLATVIVGNEVPGLLPLGLLRSLRAHILLDEDRVGYNVEPGASSELVHVESGHDAVCINEGLSNFENVPGAAEDRRTPAYQNSVAVKLGSDLDGSGVLKSESEYMTTPYKENKTDKLVRFAEAAERSPTSSVGRIKVPNDIPIRSGC